MADDSQVNHNTKTPKLSIKQSKALANLVENGGNISKAMRDAGYSAATAKTPTKLTQSQAFQYYMQEAGVTDEKLVQVLKDGLDASKTIVMGKDEDSFVDIQPDHPTRHKFLETSLKIKGIGKELEAPASISFINVSTTDKQEFFNEG